VKTANPAIQNERHVMYTQTHTHTHTNNRTLCW